MQRLQDPRYECASVDRLRERTGIRFAVEWLAPGALARSEHKARRWVDERAHRRHEQSPPPAGEAPASRARRSPRQTKR